jgi:phosphate transport system substrate-binding protein
MQAPLALRPVALLYNANGSSGSTTPGLRMSPCTFAGVIRGDVTQWDDPALVADNPGLSLPSNPITIVAPCNTYTCAMLTGLLKKST